MKSENFRSYLTNPRNPHKARHFKNWYSQLSRNLSILSDAVLVLPNSTARDCIYSQYVKTEKGILRGKIEA